MAVDWRNPLDGVDVDADGYVVPQDALQIINDINANGSRELEATHPVGTPYLDTSGDHFLAPQDALIVINYINAACTIAKFRAATVGRSVTTRFVYGSFDNIVQEGIRLWLGQIVAACHVPTSAGLASPVAPDRLSSVMLPFPVLIDKDTQTVARYGVSAYPTLVLIDPEGNQVKAGTLVLLKEKLGVKEKPPQPAVLIDPEGHVVKGAAWRC